MTCPRPDPTQKCTTCGAPPNYECPMTVDEPVALEGEAIAAGASGACDDDVCQACQ